MFRKGVRKMAYRNLFIESCAHLSCSQEQLVITTDVKRSVPMEDINSVVIENNQSKITVATLSMLSQNGVTVFFCDGKHLPCAVLMGFAQHSRNAAMVQLQEELSVPMQKRLWQQVVQAKICNQAECLALLDMKKEAAYLKGLAKTVVSGDTENVEAVAANYYFKQLFGKDFSRGDDADGRNGALNYGYAILRGHLARLIAGYGFLPMRGIHHHNEQNSFNLADDFIEPFRPVVDLYVAQNVDSKDNLMPRLKRNLYNLLNVDILSGGQRHTVAYAAERFVQSFTRCCQKTAKELLLPNLVVLQQHTYE